MKHSEILFPHKPVPPTGFRRISPKRIEENNRLYKMYSLEYQYEVVTNHYAVELKLKPLHVQIELGLLFCCVALSNGRHWLFRTLSDMEKFREYALKVTS